MDPKHYEQNIKFAKKRDDEIYLTSELTVFLQLFSGNETLLNPHTTYLFSIKRTCSDYYLDSLKKPFIEKRMLKSVTIFVAMPNQL